MALKLVYNSKEEIPDGAQLFYTQKDGKWHLLVDGVPNQADVDRLNDLVAAGREENKKLSDKLRGLGDAEPEKVTQALELVAQMGDDFDIEALNGMKTELESLKSTRNQDTAALQDEVAQLKREKNQALKESGTFKKKYEESNSLAEGLQTKINDSTIRSVLQTAAEKAKIIPEAIPDVLMYGNMLFELDAKGQVVAKDGQQSLLAGATVEDWIASQQPAKPHWWPRSESAGGNGSGNGFSGKNPWKSDSLNLSEQGKLFKENPELAKSLAKEAGVDLG